MTEKRSGRKKFITRERILEAISKTQSNRAAARYLGVDYTAYWLACKRESYEGEDLYGSHSNKQSHKNVPILKIKNTRKSSKFLKELLTGMHKEKVNSISVKRLKERLIYDGLLEEKCECCGLNEKRASDGKVPIIIYFSDNDRSNWERSNIKLMCYNCYFYYVGDMFYKIKFQTIEDMSYSIGDTSRNKISKETEERYAKHFSEFADINFDDYYSLLDNDEKKTYDNIDSEDDLISRL
jgi:hypothetical protein